MYRQFQVPAVAIISIAITSSIAIADTTVKLFTNRNDVAPIETIPVVEVGPIDLEAVQAEDQLNEQNGMPTRIAIPFPVSIAPATDGQWEILSDGAQLWRLRIAAPDARHLNLGFTHYDMPAGGELVIFAEDQGEIVRPFTAADVHDHGQLWTPIVRTSNIVLEVRLPAGVSPDDLTLELGQIAYGYRGFGTDPVILAAPRSGSCNVDVVCPQGAAWANEIPSVGVYTLSGFWTCTGAMINNTAENQVPYFLTADHCSVSSGNAASMVVYWNYENSTCRTPGSGASGGSGNGSLSQFTSGATFRADYAPSDFTLVQLNSSPPAAWGISFSGWDRTSASPSSAVCIHHPNTDEKRISFENDPVSTTSYFGTGVPGDGTHIRVTDWDLGTTEPGSSGSPLYNPQHQIIGQLHGGLAACGNNDSDWFGRLSVSWTGGGSNNSRLSNWLDPLGTGATTLNTLVPGGGSTPVCGNNIVESGETCDDGNTVSGDGCSSTCQVEVIASDGDECNDCIPIGNETVAGTTVDNTGAADDSSCGNGSGGDTIDEWYCYTATCTGTATASTCHPGTDFDTTLAAYSGCGGAELACNDDANGSPAACDLSGLNRKSIISWAVTSGTTYYIRVAGYGGAVGDFELSVACSGSAGCSNDTAANPTIIGSLPYTDVGSTAACSDNYNEVCPFTLTGSPDVVYSYTAPGDQTIDIDLCNSSYDTKVYVYAGSITPGSPIGCNDDGCPGSAPASYRSSLTGIGLTGGVTYYIIVDGYSDSDSGTFELNITGTPVAECNDPGDCDDNDPCTVDTCQGGNCVHTVIDTDNDGTPDCSDGCPTDSTKITPGVCGCGMPETPADGDLNADGTVDGRDAQSMVDGLMNGTSTWYNCHGDFNANGFLDVGDIAGLVSAMLGA